MREFNGENCVFINDCIKAHTDKCKDPCWRQREYYFLLDNSNLPERHKTDTPLYAADIDLPVFEYLAYVRDNMLKFVEGGNNLVIRGSTGTGKTCWSTKLLRAYLAQRSIGNEYNLRAIFMNIPSFVIELKKSFSSDETFNIKEFKKLRDSMLYLDLLILDDIGAVKLDKDYIHDEIYTIVNTRCDKGLSTIYTTNLTESELTDCLGVRVANRVIGNSVVVEIKNHVDMRTPDANTFSFRDFQKSYNKK